MMLLSDRSRSTSKMAIVQSLKSIFRINRVSLSLATSVAVTGPPKSAFASVGAESIAGTNKKNLRIRKVTSC